jgi:parvulin-like peptidyl-prolyl isomerase
VKRIWVSLIALVTVVALAGCSDYDSKSSSSGTANLPTSGNAAVVNGVPIENAELVKELKTFLANKAFRTALDAANTAAAAQGQTPESVVDKKGDPTPKLSASYLGQMIQYEILKQNFDSRKIKLSASDLKQGKQNAINQFNTTGQTDAASVAAATKIFDSFPKWFQTVQINNSARLFGVVRVATGYPPTTAALQAAYNAIAPDKLPNMECISHILFKVTTTAESSDTVAVEAKANALKQQINNGGNFAELAKTNSIDTGSAPNGGSLGCVNASSSGLDATFQAAADKAVVGQVTDPVVTQFGVHLILVTKKYPAAFADMKSTLLSTAQTTAQTKFGTLLTSLEKKAKITVDKVWGTITIASSGLTVTPPKTASLVTTTT